MAVHVQIHFSNFNHFWHLPVKQVWMVQSILTVALMHVPHCFHHLNLCLNAFTLLKLTYDIEFVVWMLVMKCAIKFDFTENPIASNSMKITSFRISSAGSLWHYIWFKPVRVLTMIMSVPHAKPPWVGSIDQYGIPLIRSTHLTTSV